MKAVYLELRIQALPLFFICLLSAQLACTINPFAGDDLQSILATSERILVISKSAKSVAMTLNKEGLTDDRQTLTFAKLLQQFQRNHVRFYDFVTEPSRRNGDKLNLSGSDVKELEGIGLEMKSFLPNSSDVSSAGAGRLQTTLQPLGELMDQLLQQVRKLKPNNNAPPQPVTVVFTTAQWKQIQAAKTKTAAFDNEVTSWVQ